MPGPAKKENPVRRNQVKVNVLPAVTLDPAPAWPLSDPHKHLLPVPTDGDPDKLDEVTFANARIETEFMAERETELAIWADLWAKPQATIWHRNRSDRVVARYTRLLAQAELGNTKLMPECRLLEEHLFLSAKAMSTHNITVATDEVTERRADLSVVPDPEAEKKAAAKATRRRRLGTPRGTQATG